MPLTEEYQMPFGLSDCLPRGWKPFSVGSQTRMRSVLPPLRRAGVISKLKGVKPPVCEPTVVPFTQTSVFQSEAPMWSRTRSPRHEAGTVKLRSYQRQRSAPGRSPTPERADSAAKGTRILPSNVSGAASSGRMA